MKSKKRLKKGGSRFFSIFRTQKRNNTRSLNNVNQCQLNYVITDGYIHEKFAKLTDIIFENQYPEVFVAKFIRIDNNLLRAFINSLDSNVNNLFNFSDENITNSENVQNYLVTLITILSKLCKKSRIKNVINNGDDIRNLSVLDRYLLKIITLIYIKFYVNSKKEKLQGGDNTALRQYSQLKSQKPQKLYNQNTQIFSTKLLDVLFGKGISEANMRILFDNLLDLSDKRLLDYAIEDLQDRSEWGKTISQEYQAELNGKLFLPFTELNYPFTVSNPYWREMDLNTLYTINTGELNTRQIVKSNTKTRLNNRNKQPLGKKHRQDKWWTKTKKNSLYMNTNKSERSMTPTRIKTKHKSINSYNVIGDVKNKLMDLEPLCSENPKEGTFCNKLKQSYGDEIFINIDYTRLYYTNIIQKVLDIYNKYNFEINKYIPSNLNDGTVKLFSQLINQPKISNVAYELDIDNLIDAQSNIELVKFSTLVYLLNRDPIEQTNFTKKDYRIINNLLQKMVIQINHIQSELAVINRFIIENVNTSLEQINSSITFDEDLFKRYFYNRDERGPGGYYIYASKSLDTQVTSEDLRYIVDPETHYKALMTKINIVQSVINYLLYNNKNNLNNASKEYALMMGGKSVRFSETVNKRSSNSCHPLINYNYCGIPMCSSSIELNERLQSYNIFDSKLPSKDFSIDYLWAENAMNAINSRELEFRMTKLGSSPQMLVFGLFKVDKKIMLCAFARKYNSLITGMSGGGILNTIRSIFTRTKKKQQIPSKYLSENNSNNDRTIFLNPNTNKGIHDPPQLTFNKKATPKYRKNVSELDKRYSKYKNNNINTSLLDESKNPKITGKLRFNPTIQQHVEDNVSNNNTISVSSNYSNKSNISNISIMPNINKTQEVPLTTNYNIIMYNTDQVDGKYCPISVDKIIDFDLNNISISGKYLTLTTSTDNVTLYGDKNTFTNLVTALS